MFVHCAFLRGDDHVWGVVPRHMMVVEGLSVGPCLGGPTMQLKRLAAVVLATASLSLGVATAPAQADTSWGCGGFCRPPR